MKSRWTTYLLIAAVITVWGVVAWKIFQPAHPVSGPIARQPAVPAVAASDAATLQLDYPDPFLKETARPIPAARTAEQRRPSAKKTASRRERIAIEHLATVAVDGHTLYILTIGKGQYELHEGETAGAYRLTKSDRDSLYLEYKGEIYGVKRCE